MLLCEFLPDAAAAKASENNTPQCVLTLNAIEPGFRGSIEDEEPAALAMVLLDWLLALRRGGGGGG